MSQTENDELVAFMEKMKLVYDSDGLTKQHKINNNLDLADHPPLTTTAISNPTPTKKMNDTESPFFLGGQQYGLITVRKKTQSLTHHNNNTHVHQILDQPNTKQITITTIIIIIKKDTKNETNNNINKSTQIAQSYRDKRII